MPYIGVDLDALPKMEGVARALGISTGDVAIGLLRLWEHVWRQKPNDHVGEVVITGCFGRLEPGVVALIDALVAFDFLAPPELGPTAVEASGPVALKPGDIVFVEATPEAGPKHPPRRVRSNLWRVKGAKSRLFRHSEAGKAGGRKTAASGKSLRNLLRGELRESFDNGGSENTQPVEASPKHPRSTARSPANSQQPTAVESKDSLSSGSLELDDADTATALQALWNADAAPELARWTQMPPGRRKAADARLREHPLSDWPGIIARVNASAFLRGLRGDGKWRASIDWLLKPGNLAKVLEGAYDDGGPPGARASVRKCCVGWCDEGVGRQVMGTDLCDTHFAAWWREYDAAGRPGEFLDSDEGREHLGAWIADRERVSQ